MMQALDLLIKGKFLDEVTWISEKIKPVAIAIIDAWMH